MTTIKVALAERGYDIRIDSGLLSKAPEFEQSIAGNQVFIISNQVVAPLYLEKLLGLLEGKEVYSYVLADGEQTKSLANYSLVVDKMLSIPCDRNVTVIALGGGVVGDLAGFVAASYQRGVPLIQVPTTLLSQVDSSVGGKTGVNHALGKNMIGAFYQPRRVLADIDTLSTLAPRQLAAGMAEVIKYGLINDYPFFCWLEQNIEAAMALDSATIKYTIAQSCANKARMVAQDERESGVRALLNLGHTFGHAIETATGYSTWLHGEAVAIGLSMAAFMSVLCGWLQPDDLQRVNRLLARAKLPWQAFDDVSPEQLRRLMQIDKKVQNGRLRLILLQALGEAVAVDDYSEPELDATLSAYATG